MFLYLNNDLFIKVEAHDDDVNTVTFADNTSQIVYSGGDDGLCKVRQLDIILFICCNSKVI